MAETRGTGADAETRAAREILEHILKLEMAPARWERLSHLIEIAIGAEAAGDRDGLRHATVELELAGPVRITRIGDSPSVPPPPAVRERVNHLIHALSTDAGRDAGEDER